MMPHVNRFLPPKGAHAPLEAARRYRLADVTAGSSGNEGGDS